MPTSSEILAILAAIANDGILAAVAWHLALLAALVAIAIGWRPHRATAALLLAMPLASAAGFSLAYGNPFNAVVLGAGAIAIAVLGRRAGDRRVEGGPTWATALGVALVTFGAVYPEFLVGWPPIAYLLAAPFGLIPCPSLAVVMGLTLLAGGVDRRIAAVLAGLGAFYGLFGVLRLGVTLDVPLLFGAAALAERALTAGRARGPTNSLAASH